MKKDYGMPVGCKIAAYLLVFFVLALFVANNKMLWASPSLLLISESAGADLSGGNSSLSTPLFYSLDDELMSRIWKGVVDSISMPVNGQYIEFQKTTVTVRDKSISWEGVDPSGTIKALFTLGRDHLYGQVVGEFGTLIFASDGAERIAVKTVGAEEALPRVVVRQLDPKKEVEFGHDYLVPPHAAGESEQAGQTEQMPHDAAAAPEDGSRIDVMVLYTDGMAAAHPGDQITTRIQYLIDLGNQSFTNSGINTRFHLVHAQQVSYPDDSPGDMEEALNNLTDNVGVFAGAEELRTRYGADQVVLLRQYVDEGCGLAWINTGYFDDARYAYAVVQDGSRTDGSGFYCSELGYVHEIGHNLGCNHDRDNTTTRGRYPYSYGYQSPTESFRTVMAYNCPDGCPRISFFSNPTLQYQGEALGIPETASNSADNARTINQTRIEMANYRTTVTLNESHGGHLPSIFLLLLNKK